MRRASVCICCTALLVAVFSMWGCGDPPASSLPSTTAYDKDGYLPSGVPRPDAPPNLVMIVVDTLRADAIALPGDAHEGRMPYVSELARSGVSFSSATSAAPWTLPSLTSMLTGLMPSEHGVNVSETAAALPGRFTTAAEALRNGYGYETMGFVAGPWVEGRTSLWQGFRAQSGSFMLQGADDQLRTWTEELDPNRPFFLLLHTFEAHDPYGARNHPWPKTLRWSPPPDYDASLVTDPAQQTFDFLTDRRRRMALQRVWGRGYIRDVMKYMYTGYGQNPDPELAARLAAAYWDGVRWVDGHIRSTVDLLRRKGLLDDTLLVITSDHGEAFGEHGTLEHGRQLYDELVRVPLVMVDFRKDAAKQAFRGGRVVRSAAGTIDILPTFFEYAGLRALDDIHGRSFLARIAGDAPGDPVLSEEILGFNNTATHVDAVLRSARSDRWKYIVTFDKGDRTAREELYDLLKDPGEQDNLAAHTPLARIATGPRFRDAVEGLRDGVWAPQALDPATRPPPVGSQAQSPR